MVNQPLPARQKPTPCCFNTEATPASLIAACNLCLSVSPLPVNHGDVSFAARHAVGVAVWIKCRESNDSLTTGVPDFFRALPDRQVTCFAARFSGNCHSAIGSTACPA